MPEDWRSGPPARRAFRIEGRVQGVGFRAFVRREAHRLGLAGWVRNEPDGAVAVEAAGSPDDLDALERALRDGPSAGRVTRVEARALPGEAATGGDFEVRF